MDISQYFKSVDQAVSFDESQASAFAKGVAGDFNPIHDPGGKRFCVPGDLLFSVLLHRYGLAQSTSVQFSGMLDSKTRMLLPDQASDVNHVVDSRERALLSLFLAGRRYTDASFVAIVSTQYVRFSGQTFPDILVPLMRDAGVMINPDRPLVIYKDMSIEFNKTVEQYFEQSDSDTGAQLREPLASELSLQIAGTDISVNGRKGSVRLQFTIELGGKTIGTGEKNMVLSGLREFEEAAMQAVVEQYNSWRDAYRQSQQPV